MEETKKLTKRENFENLKAIVENSNVEMKEDIMSFIDKQIELLDNKALKAKERSAQKKAEGDELREVVKSVLTEDFQNADEITAQIAGEDVTKAKIIARLTQLVKNGDAVKEDRTEDGKRKKVYKLA